MAQDFRLSEFTATQVINSGKFLGRRFYWRFYFLENFLRVLVHSILSVQLGPEWLDLVADKKLKNRISWSKSDYKKNPRHATPGEHDIYFVSWSDLVKIMTFNSNLFMPVIPNIDEWVLRFESLRISRNLVAHMNWPNQHDMSLIEETYIVSKSLLRTIGTSGIEFQIP